MHSFTYCSRTKGVFFDYLLFPKIAVVYLDKKWKKFGEAANDPPGINPTTTKVGDELKMEFTSKMVKKLFRIFFL
jgi:hypothetical protein